MSSKSIRGIVRGLGRSEFYKRLLWRESIQDTVKGLAMYLARAVLVQGFPVNGRPVAFVRVEPVNRICLVILPHQVITIRFCEHRRSGYRS